MNIIMRLNKIVKNNNFYYICDIYYYGKNKEKT